MSEASHLLTSSHLGNERTVWLRFPGAAKCGSRRVVFLDAEFYRERVGAISVIEELERRSMIPPAQYAFVSCHSPERRWIECPCYRPFSRFVVDELLPWLDSVQADACHAFETVIAGLSYTGLAAAYVAIESPGAFTKVLAQSGSFWWNDCWLADHYRACRERIPTEFYLDVGSREVQQNVEHKEDVLQRISQIEGVRRFRDALIEKGHDPKYVEFDGGHEFAAWGRTLPDALRWALCE